MARDTDPGMVLKVLLGRISKKSNAEIADQLGYKRPGSISDMVNRFGLQEAEDQIRLILSGQGKEIPPEAIALNAEYDQRQRSIGDKLFALTEGELNAWGGKSYRINEIKALEAASRALEAIRQARLKSVTFNESMKPSEKEHEIKTSFRDLLDAEEDDDE